MRHYITKDTANRIKRMFDPSRHEHVNITEWSQKVHGVTFDGGLRTEYYLEGPAEKITWFLLQI